VPEIFEGYRESFKKSLFFLILLPYRLHTTIVFSFLFFVKMTHFESLKTYDMGSFFQTTIFSPKNRQFPKQNIITSYAVAQRKNELNYKI